MPPHTPDEIIAELCRRHGVSLAFGKRLRALIERAQCVPDESARRIMDLVERSFAQEAERLKREPEAPSEDGQPSDDRILHAVAAILHNWDPPGWLKEWSRTRHSDDTSQDPPA